MQSLSPEERKGLLLSVGTHRAERPLSPVEVAALLAKARSKSTLREIAEGLHLRDTSILSEFLGLLELPVDVQALVDWGRGTSATLAFSAARELRRLRTTERAEAADAILRSGLKSSDVRQVVQLRLRSGKPIEDCIGEIKRLNPELIQRHVVIGSVADLQLREKLNRYSQVARDKALRCGLAEILGSALPADAEIRMGPTRFVVVGDQRLGGRIAALGDFETAVLAAVGRHLPEPES